jgi:PilZ domain
MSARIFLPNGQLECSTVDVSGAGAQLSVKSDINIPREFDIWISGGLVLPARLIWRSTGALGIRFI